MSEMLHRQSGVEAWNYWGSNPFRAQLASILAIVWLASVLPGCSGKRTGSIEGRVIVDGQPAEGIAVTFHPLAGMGEGFGVTKEDGRYVLYRGRGNRDFSVGQYKVTLSSSGSSDGPQSPPVKLPQTVTSFEETTLRETVGPGRNVIDLKFSAKK